LFVNQVICGLLKKAMVLEYPWQESAYLHTMIVSAIQEDTRIDDLVQQLCYGHLYETVRISHLFGVQITVTTYNGVCNDGSVVLPANNGIQLRDTLNSVLFCSFREEKRKKKEKKKKKKERKRKKKRKMKNEKTERKKQKKQKKI